jgi:phosphoglycolate phosphatase
MRTLVFFDLDGILVDAPRAIVDTFSHTMRLLGTAPVSADAVPNTSGMPLGKAFRDLPNISPGDALIGKAIDLFKSCYREIVLPQANELMFWGVVSGLRFLRQQGVILTIATSRFQASADTMLEVAVLDGYFGYVVGCNKGRNPKPPADSAQKIQRHFKVPVENAVVIGDATYDVLMAKGASMKSIAMTFGVHEPLLKSGAPTWMVDSFCEAVKHILPMSHREMAYACA